MSGWEGLLSRQRGLCVYDRALLAMLKLTEMLMLAHALHTQGLVVQESSVHRSCHRYTNLWSENEGGSTKHVQHV